MNLYLFLNSEHLPRCQVLNPKDSTRIQMIMCGSIHYYYIYIKSTGHQLYINKQRHNNKKICFLNKMHKENREMEKNLRLS